MKKTKDNAPRAFRPPPAVRGKGLIMVNTGGGKGKSTAAFGTALRAAGHGWNVAVVQFIKGKWKTGEQKAAKLLGPRLKIYAYGEGFTWQTKDYEKDVLLAEKAWQKALRCLQDKTHRLVILDEINYCLAYNFIETDRVIDALRKKPDSKHVFLTGGGAPEELIRIADLVTEMKEIKHPYRKGILAQAGIDF